MLFALIVLAPRTARAAPSFGLQGSSKTILGHEQLNQREVYDSNTSFFGEQRLRLLATLHGEWFHLELADEFSLLNSPYNPTAVPLPSGEPKGWWEAQWELVDTEEARLRHRLDRAFVQLTFGNTDLIVGKQAVGTGVAKVFSVISQRPRVPLVTADPEFQRPQDAVSLVFRGSTSFEARYFPLIEGQRAEDFHLRARRPVLGYDVALTVGRADDKPMVGLEWAGDLGEAVLRGEVGAFRDTQKNAWVMQALLGWERALNAKWTLQLEGFYNGFGGGDLSRRRHRGTEFRDKYYASVGISHEFTPRLKGSGLSILNLEDPSAFFHLHLSYSLADNTDVLMGQFIGAASDSESEFGGAQKLFPVTEMAVGMSDLTYLMMRMAF